MSEDEIITNVKRIIEYKVISNYINNNDSRAIQGLLDLYQKEKDLNQELQIRYKIENDKYKEEKEKNKDLWKAYLDVSNDRDNNYIRKDKVKELFYKKRGIIEREELKELLEENKNEM